MGIFSLVPRVIPPVTSHLSIAFLMHIMYCLTRKTLSCNSLVLKICMFRQKETSHCNSSLALGLQRTKHYIFGNQSYSKNARKLRFHVFILFDARKYMISSFYLKWTKFTRNCELFSNYGSPGTPTKLEQTGSFLWIWTTSGKMMISYVF